MRTPKYTRPKGRENRRAILDAAVTVFAERGYRGTTFNEIARRVGMTQPGLMHHFVNKETLLLEVVREHEQANSPSVEAHMGPGALDMQAAIEALARANRDAPGEQLLVHTLTAEAVREEHPLHEHFQSTYRTNRAKLTAVLERGRGEGVVRDDIDAAATARQIIATLDGLRLQWLLDPEQVPLDDVLKDYAKQVAAWLQPAPAAPASRSGARAAG